MDRSPILHEMTYTMQEGRVQDIEVGGGASRQLLNTNTLRSPHSLRSLGDHKRMGDLGPQDPLDLPLRVPRSTWKIDYTIDEDQCV